MSQLQKHTVHLKGSKGNGFCSLKALYCLLSLETEVHHMVECGVQQTVYASFTDVTSETNVGQNLTSETSVIQNSETTLGHPKGVA